MQTACSNVCYLQWTAFSAHSIVCYLQQLAFFTAHSFVCYLLLIAYPYTLKCLLSSVDSILCILKRLLCSLNCLISSIDRMLCILIYLRQIIIICYLQQIPISHILYSHSILHALLIVKLVEFRYSVDSDFHAFF